MPFRCLCDRLIDDRDRKCPVTIQIILNILFLNGGTLLARNGNEFMCDPMSNTVELVDVDFLTHFFLVCERVLYHLRLRN